MTIRKYGSAEWLGGLKDGQGSISTQTGALSAYPYGFKARFEGGVRGTNPEELIAAAHAGCFTMALSAALGEAGHVPTSLLTTATISLDKVADGFEIPSIHLSLKGKVPGIDRTAFETIANNAKKNCPVSKLLRAEITLDIELEQ